MKNVKTNAVLFKFWYKVFAQKIEITQFSDGFHLNVNY